MQTAGIFKVLKNCELQIREIQNRKLQGLPVSLKMFKNSLHTLYQLQPQPHRGQMSILYGGIPILILIMAFVNNTGLQQMVVEVLIEVDIIYHQVERRQLICHIIQLFHQVSTVNSRLEVDL